MQRAGASIVRDGRRRLKELERAGLVRVGWLEKPPVESIGTGSRALNAILPGGGFPRGFLTELAGPASSGKLTIAIRTAAAALWAGERAALVTTGEFFPGLSPNVTRSIERLLVCRITSAVDALAAGETLASSGGIDMLAIDLAAMPQTGDGLPGAIARLERAVRQERVATLLLTDLGSAVHGSIGSAAALRLEITSGRNGIPTGHMTSHVRLARSRFGRAGVRQAV